MKRPFVEANFAVTVDGKISTRAYAPTGFTSARDKRRLLEIRAGGDALLIGRGTLEADNMAMALPARDLQEMRLREGRTAEPLRVIFSNRGNLRTDLKVFRSRGAPIVIFTTRAMPAAARRKLEKLADVRVEVRRRTVDLPAAFAVLAHEYGVRDAVCEGGPTLIKALLEQNLLDRLHITFAPLIFGGAAAPTLIGPADRAVLSKSIPLTLESLKVEGSEAFASYRVGSPRPSARAGVCWE
jgi:riboflavin-specific deaminase-like protein